MNACAAGAINERRLQQRKDVDEAGSVERKLQPDRPCVGMTVGTGESEVMHDRRAVAVWSSIVTAPPARLLRQSPRRRYLRQY